jgi:hypothetical protein
MKINGIHVTNAQKDVYAVLRQFPHGLADQALVPLAQHQLSVHQSSSGIRTRRLELQRKGLVKDTGQTIRTGKGRSAVVFKAVR